MSSSAPTLLANRYAFLHMGPSLATTAFIRNEHCRRAAGLYIEKTTILPCNVYAAYAHIVLHCSKVRYFKSFADAINVKVDSSFHAGGKILRDW